MASNSNNSGTSSMKLTRLKDKSVKDVLSPEKRRLVEVPYTATLAHTVNVLVANRVVAVPVAAPPGHWIGAGGSMILEADKATGTVRKHYIGMITMLDILAYIAEDSNLGGATEDLDRRMSVPVSSIIGHCLESLSLWTLNPHTSIVDCMEVFSKGIHRAMVPLDSTMENIVGVELVESASGYRMLTQMDLLKFLKAHEPQLHRILSRTVARSGGVSDIVFGVTDRAKVIETIKHMRSASLNAVPVIESYDDIEEDHTELVNGKGRKIIGTFSATDLRECPIPQMQPWLRDNVITFKNRLRENAPTTESPKELVTCRAESPLSEVIDKAVTYHVHRVWVTDRNGLLEGLVSLTDIIRVIRVSMASESS